MPHYSITYTVNISNGICPSMYMLMFDCLTLYGKCLCCIIPDVAASALFVLPHGRLFIMPHQVPHIRVFHMTQHHNCQHHTLGVTIHMCRTLVHKSRSVMSQITFNNIGAFPNIHCFLFSMSHHVSYIFH